MLCVGEMEFAGQRSQAELPTNDLYVPRKHILHGPPSGPVHPVSHRQAVRMILPAGETEINGQFVQVAFPNAALNWLT